MSVRRLLAGLAGLVACGTALAQGPPEITSDGTLGTIVNRDVPASTYTISGGTIVDSNQFHSFELFGLSSGQTADFTGPAGIVNILGRVTGGFESTIDGTIRSSIPGANLWLINPNGVVFESGASLDVSGSFHVSTADYLVLEGGGQFFANTNAGFEPLLLVGDPVSFGFLTAPTKDIVLRSAMLEVDPGAAMSFVAREVRLEQGSTGLGSSLTAPGGRLDLASVGSAGEIHRLADGLDNTGITYNGDGERVGLTGKSALDVSGEGGGSIYIRAGRFAMGPDEFDDETVRADTLGGTDGGVIDIRARFDVGIRGLVTANSSDSGTGGDIFVSGRTIFTPNRGGGIAGPAALETQAFAAGNAGSITLAATNISLEAPLRVGTSGPGAAGDVNITGVNFDVASTSEVSSSTSGPGAGGDINVTVTGRLGLHAGTFRAETTAATGGGPAGNITLMADTISNPGSDGYTISTNTRGDGAGGNILLDAATSIDLDSGMLLSDATSVGQGGSITLRAPLIDLHDNIDNTPVTLSSTTAGSGNAGRITLDGDAVRIRDGASITASTSGPGSAGDVVISARLFDLLQSSTITSDSFGSLSGAAGSIDVSAGTASITNDSAISVKTASDMADNVPGSIAIRATDAIVIDSVGSLTPPRLSAETAGAAPGGGILLEAPAVTIRDSLIQASTEGSGDAGIIEIVGSNTLDIVDARVVAGTGAASGWGGSIALRGGLVSITDSELLANTLGGASGDAGDITVSAGSATLAHAFIEAATDTSGAGGNIALTATDSLTIAASGSGATTITARATDAGPGGTISIGAGSLLVTGGSEIAATTSGVADGGSISITAGTAIIEDASVRADTAGAGAAGDIAVSAELFDLQGPSAVASSSAGAASGSAGSIDVSAGTVSITGGASMSVSTDSDVAGNTPGSIAIGATDQITVDSDDLTNAALSAETAGAAPGGGILLEAPAVTVRDSRIRATTTGAGDAGNIEFSGSTTLNLVNSIVEAGTDDAGQGGSITLGGGFVTITDVDLLANTRGFATGDAGNVIVLADSAVITHAFLETATDTTGAGGNIALTAVDSLTIAGNSSGSTLITAKTSGAGRGGAISIDAGSLLATGGSEIAATTSGVADGGSISIAAATAVIDDAEVRAGTTGAGAAGDIGVTAGLFDLRGSATMASQSQGTDAGSAGSIDVSASTVSITGGASMSVSTDSDMAGNVPGVIAIRASEQILVDADDLTNAALSAETLGAARGGGILLAAPTVTVLDSLLQASTTGSGRAGDISIAAIDAILTNARLEATTSDSGSGGNVLLAADTLRIDGNANGDTVVAATTLGDGDGGAIELTFGSLHLGGAAEVAVTSDAAGRGGVAIIKGTDVVVGGTASLRGTTSGTGTGGAILIDAGSVVIREGGTVTATTDGPGAGGSIRMSADSLTVSDDGRVLAETGPTATGAAGSLTIDAGTLLIEGNGTISGATTGAGSGGTVAVTATDLLVQGSGSLSVRTDGAGSGGDIRIDADQSRVTGGGSVTAAATGDGPGGSIEIIGGELRVDDGGRILATTSGPANGGSIRIAPTRLTMETLGSIAVSASGSGNAGAIDIDAGESIDLRDARIESASTLSDGGNVSVSAGDFIVLNDSTITTSADSLSGNAGNIRVGADTIPASPAFLIMQRSAIQANAGASGGAINVFAQYILGSGNVIEAISDTGNDGQIVFDVPATDLVSVLSQLDLPIIDVAALLNDRCAVSALGERSSFIVEPGGVPPSPESYLSTGYYLPGGPSSAAALPGPQPVVFAFPLRRRGC